MPSTRLALALLALPACVAVDPTTLELQPALELSCQHPDAWFEGIYPTPSAPSHLTAAPAATRTARPLPPPSSPRPAGMAPPGSATWPPAPTPASAHQTGFLYRCPDTGWRVTAGPTLAPPPALLPDPLTPDACYPDSACAAAFAAPIGLALRGPSALAGPTDHTARADAHLALNLPGAQVRHPLHARAPAPAPAPATTAHSASSPPLTLRRRRRPQPRPPPASSTSPSPGPQTLGLELLRPALADLDPVTGTLRFPASALGLRISSPSPPAARSTRPAPAPLRNPPPIHGRLADGALTLAAEFPLASLGGARLDLELQPTAHPPIADLTPQSPLRAGPLPQDPHAPSPLHRPRPDDDLASLIWVVDGIGTPAISAGRARRLALWVADRPRRALARSPPAASTSRDESSAPAAFHNQRSTALRQPQLELRHHAPHRLRPPRHLGDRPPAIAPPTRHQRLHPPRAADPSPSPAATSGESNSTTNISSGPPPPTLSAAPHRRLGRATTTAHRPRGQRGLIPQRCVPA
ncbi:hypothetical protein [Nannocystis sp.]|uniref:hypothetical protein n=1 Tax=Nannocystis sp. TaxID=1962667 RepID=UPI0025E7EB1C|nr:hypothetical protein [Nannocystis sp.]MBK7828932.1 hypothetical protein [Nannocystis sp.]